MTACLLIVTSYQRTVGVAVVCQSGGRTVPNMVTARLLDLSVWFSVE